MDMHAGGHYSAPLVILSIIIAIFASYVSCDLSHKSLAALNSRFRFLFLLSSSFAMGIGIWSMHFVGMLAYHTVFPVSYNLLLTGVSFIIPIISSFVAYRLASSMKTYRFIIAGFMLGTGISSMHYIGMAAMESAYTIKYDTLLFVLSVLIAVGVSFFSIFRKFQPPKAALDMKGKWTDAILMGSGISGMHYTAMNAAHFTAFSNPVKAGSSLFTPILNYVVEPNTLAYTVCLALFLLIGFVFFGVHVDRRLAYEAASMHALHFQSLFDHNPDIVCSFDLQGRFISVNAATLRVTGYTKDELMDRKLADLLVPDETERVHQLFEQVKQGEPQNFEVDGLHQQGHKLDFSVTAIPIVFKKRIIGVFAVCRDFTERNRNEEMLRKTEKLAMAGQLAAGIAHEIRNPLTTVRGMTQLIKSGIMKQEYLDVMMNDIRQIESILSEFLLLASPNPEHYKVCDLHEIIRSIAMLMDAQAILYDIRIKVEYGAETPWICCDENKIKHVFTHLLKNAIESMEHGGDIKVQVYFTSHDKVQIRFLDQGTGISDEWMKKMGEPFYSTKEKGTGIGLMISYKIIQEHNGRIDIYSAGRIGTVVDVTLPAVSGK
ncbi:MHYT domain-containing protein [Paenibacillus piri]|uniref:histidine kinase n=1 Tax=Paenibacillus piri TaxID=2547395 RepID=A0A4R5KX03_9BACL|nr:MHYT domain-containing protein [Paenibacillus piri]TDG00347.1 PAS domain S-box protein [Paenibacillus piri]